MAIARRKYTNIDFRNEPPTPVLAVTTNAVATGADNQIDYTWVGGKVLMDWIQTGQNDAIMPVLRTAAPLGWALPLDDSTDSVEMGEGGLVNAASPYKSFTVGTDDAFFIRGQFSFLNNVDDVAACVVGFRDVASQVDVTSAADLLTAYTNTAYLGIAANDGTLSSNTQKGAVTAQTAATHAATSTALTATTGITFKLLVSSTGAVTYQIDGASDAALAAVSYTYTNATALVPAMHFVHRNGNGNAASETVIQEYECGYQ